MTKTLQDFVSKSSAVHSNRYSYDRITSLGKMTDHYEITCPEHGSFFQVGSAHQRGSGCPKCAKQTIASKNRYTLAQYIDAAQAIHGSFYDYSLIEWPFTSNTKITIVCPFHGAFSVRATNHLSYKTGCSECGEARRVGRAKLGYDQIEQRTRVLHGNRYILLDRPDRTEIESRVLCENHGEFVIEIASLLRGNGCPTCQSSRGSIKQNLWLDSVGLPRSPAVRELVIHVGDGIGKQYLRVDGFDRTINTIYEFHGDLWHGNPHIYKRDHVNPKNKRTMGDLYDATIAKVTRLRAAGYKVVEMWESEWDARMKNGIR